MFCGNCGNQVADGSKFCGSCGAPMGAGAGQDLAQDTFADEAAAKKSGRGKLAAIAAVAAAALVIAAGAVNAGWIYHFVRRTFSSPEQYYQLVEGKYLSELSKSGGEWYGAYVLEALNLYDKSLNGELEIALGKGGGDFLGLLGLAGVDVSWFQSAAIHGGISVKDDVLEADTELQLNKTPILSGTVILDRGKERVYARIPEIHQKYIGADLDVGSGYGNGYDTSDIFALWAANEEMVKAFPVQDQMEKLLSRYMLLALKNIKNVEMGKAELTAEGISQQCIVLDVVIDSDTMRDIADAILEEMQDDKELKAYIIGVIESSDMDMDADGVYENFQQALDYAMGQTAYLSDADIEIRMQVYVDGKGEIRGRKVTLDDGLVTIQNFMPRKGGKFGYELSGKSGSQTVKLSGSGKVNGDKINGDFSAKYNGASFLDLTVRELNTKDLKKGYLNASVEAQMSPQFGRLLAGRNPYLVIAQKLKLNMDFASSPKSYSCRLGIIYDEQDLGSISALVKIEKGNQVSIPKAGDTLMAEDEGDLREWLEGCDLEELITAMKKAGIPSEYTDILEEVNDALLDGNWLRLMGILYAWD